MVRKLSVIILVNLLIVPVSGQEEEPKNTFINGIPKNSVYAELGGNGMFASLNYERILALSEKAALAPRVGFGFWEVPLPLLELTLLGGGKHAFETGPGITWMPGSGSFVVTARAGYRFMGKKGLLIRAAPMLWLGINEGSTQPLFHFGISAGYSF